MNNHKKQKKKKNIVISKEVYILLDRLHRRCVNYNSVEEKSALLKRYFNAVKYRVSGKKVSIKIEALIADLPEKNAPSMTGGMPDY